MVEEEEKEDDEVVEEEDPQEADRQEFVESSISPSSVDLEDLILQSSDTPQPVQDQHVDSLERMRTRDDEMEKKEEPYSSTPQIYQPNSSYETQIGSQNTEGIREMPVTALTLENIRESASPHLIPRMNTRVNMITDADMAPVRHGESLVDYEPRSMEDMKKSATERESERVFKKYQ